MIFGYPRKAGQIKVSLAAFAPAYMDGRFM